MGQPSMRKNELLLHSDHCYGTVSHLFDYIAFIMELMLSLITRMEKSSRNMLCVQLTIIKLLQRTNPYPLLVFHIIINLALYKKIYIGSILEIACHSTEILNIVELIHFPLSITC
jgi:hypothetical protein